MGAGESTWQYGTTSNTKQEFVSDTLISSIMFDMEILSIKSIYSVTGITANDPSNPNNAHPETIITMIKPVDTTPDPTLEAESRKMMLYHILIAILSVLIGVVIGRYTVTCVPVIMRQPVQQVQLVQPVQNK